MKYDLETNSIQIYMDIVKYWDFMGLQELQITLDDKKQNSNVYQQKINIQLPPSTLEPDQQILKLLVRRIMQQLANQGTNFSEEAFE